MASALNLKTATILISQNDVHTGRNNKSKMIKGGTCGVFIAAFLKLGKPSLITEYSKVSSVRQQQFSQYRRSDPIAPSRVPSGFRLVVQ
jgi:hypothetical protein